MTYCYECDRYVAKPTIVEHRPYCDSCAADVSQADNVPKSGTLNSAEPSASLGRQSVSEYAAEVTAEIDAVIRDYYGERPVLAQQTAGAVPLNETHKIAPEHAWPAPPPPPPPPPTAEESSATVRDSRRVDDLCGYGEETHPPAVETSSDDDEMTLAEQIARYGERCELVLDALRDNLFDERFRKAIIRLGVERLTEGYDDFGSTMYSWVEEKRDDEMFEELADYVVYGTSGPFFWVDYGPLPVGGWDV